MLQTDKTFSLTSLVCEKVKNNAGHKPKEELYINPKREHPIDGHCSIG